MMDAEDIHEFHYEDGHHRVVRKYKVKIEWEGVFETDDEDDLTTLAIENFDFGSVDFIWEECD